MRTRRALAFLGALSLSIFLSRTGSAQASLPAGWPARFELGLADAPGGAAAMKQTAPFGFRYQYLAGGVNTGSSWSTWNTNGDFPRFYIQDSVANAITPIFTYYMLLQSSPGGGSESDADFANLNNTATMTAYYNDLTLFFQKAAAFPSQRVVLHVEPDFWGYMEQRAANDDARTVPAKVAETGNALLVGLPSNVSGFARAIVALRNAYAPNVTLAYHVSVWGTSVDIALQNPSDASVDVLASRAGAFYRSLDAHFDIAFAEFSDRDSGFYQYVYGDNGRSWWDADDFRRNVRFLGGFSDAAALRIVMWQIPIGNTRMRSQNNTTGHYQDNRPEWLLDDAGRTHLSTYRDAGVVALLFGGGAGGTTCACDSQRDGVTNPASIGGNVIVSELAAAGAAPALVLRGSTTTLVTPHAADDDGGYLRWRSWQYYQDGAMTLATVSGTPPVKPRGVRIVR
jgi:hypothetical protein